MCYARSATRMQIAIMLFGLLLSVPATASATPPVPLLDGPNQAVGTPLGQGIVVQSLPDEWGGPPVIRYNFKGTSPSFADTGLFSESGDPPATELLSPWDAEATASDLQGDFTAFIEYFGEGGSELYAKLVGGTTVLNPSDQSEDFEDYPAVYVSGVTRHLVWQQGAGANWEVKYMGPVSPTGSVVSFGSGQRPAISQHIVAWEDGAGDIKYTLNRGATYGTFGSVTEVELLPAVGGNRIFYEAVDANGATRIAFRNTNSIATQHMIAGPCNQQFKPRVSGDGRYLLYTGAGCPVSDGIQPLYLVNIDANRNMNHYLVADLGHVDVAHHHLPPYDIDLDAIAYQVANGGGYTSYWAQLDAVMLP